MTKTEPIRVFLVDDSIVALTLLRRLINSFPDMSVVGTARNGKEALEMIPQVKPSIICTDLEMPVMNGLQLTRAIMVSHPCPILVISSFVQKEDAATIFKLLQAGAIDVFPKPRGGLDPNQSVDAEQLMRKIRIVSGVTAFRRRRTALENAGLGPAVQENSEAPRIVAIGASTGGPIALHTIFQKLPKEFPVPIVCVQHIADGFLQGLVHWLSSEILLRVKVVQSGEIAEPGVIYFPEEGTHLLAKPNGRLVSMRQLPVHGHIPSATSLLGSVAACYGRQSIGVLLTGMGGDGAEGLKAMFDTGACTVAQDENTSVVFGMPRQAIELGAARHVLPLNRIAEFLTERCPIEH